MNSLRTRLVISLVLIVAVTLVSAGVAFYARLGGYREDLATGTLRQVAAPIYYNLTLFQPQPAQRGTVNAGRKLRAELSEYLELQRQESGVIVLLLDADGRVIPESTTDETLRNERFDVPSPPQAGPNFEELVQSRHTTSDGRTLIYVTVPTTKLVRNQAAGIHAVVVALPESSASDVIGDLTPRLLFAGGVGLGAALVAALLLWASLYGPLGKVAGGIRAVAHGDYRQRVPESGPTEVRRLAADVNRMADSVQASQRTLREFLANVGHELKTPLTSIRGFSQAMLDGTLDTAEERARAARVIDAESRRVLHLVEELLDLSRIESGQQPMALAEVPVAELLAHVADVFSMRAGESGVSLAIEQPGDTLVCMADFDRIEQVLGNLIDNAFRHTRRGGGIEAGAREAAGGFVELYVTDDGEGIAPADLPHVFERFYRGERGEPGSGLGLAISREIVRAHGGEIRVEARAGGGTAFRFTLPRSPAGPAARQAQRRSEPGGPPMRDAPAES